MNIEHDADDPIPFPGPSIGEDWWRATAEYRTIFRLTLPTQVFWTLAWIVIFKLFF